MPTLYNLMLRKRSKFVYLSCNVVSREGTISKYGLQNYSLPVILSVSVEVHWFFSLKNFCIIF